MKATARTVTYRGAEITLGDLRRIVAETEAWHDICLVTFYAPDPDPPYAARSVQLTVTQDMPKIQLASNPLLEGA